MGKLHVTFKVGLTHPVMLPQELPNLPVVATFPTGNTVRIEPPRMGPVGGTSFGAFDEMVLHVERECTDEEGRNAAYTNWVCLHIPQDAGHAFWRLFETIRDLQFGRHIVAGYPVTHAEDIQRNPLVRKCEAEWTYDGISVPRTSFTGLASIGIDPDSWAGAVRRIADGATVPGYRSFALDACYFATSGDPLRAIVMACAAWETALRHYLEHVTASRDPACRVADIRGIKQLYRFAQAARGGPLFYDWTPRGPTDREALERQRNMVIEELPDIRNKFLHRGEAAIPQSTAMNFALAVLNAIDWLFGSHRP